MKQSNRIFSPQNSLSVDLQNPRSVKNPASKVEELKSLLVEKLSAEYTGLDGDLVYRAVSEAHALASLTGVPLLLLPVLAEEKVQQAQVWSTRQRSVLQGQQFAFAA